MKDRIKKVGVGVVSVVEWTLVSPYLGALLVASMVGSVMGTVKRKIQSKLDAGRL